jgi:hypothetical protein
MKTTSTLLLTASLVFTSCGGDWYEVLLREHCRLHPGAAECREPVCAQFVGDCMYGPPADSDGDGCPDTCRPGDGGRACVELAVYCAPGSHPADIDGDSCALECEADTVDGGVVACPAIAVLCGPGSHPGDVDGDGCALECLPDTVDAGRVCPAYAPVCPPGSTVIDANGDGCAQECGGCQGPADAGLSPPERP